MIRVFHLIKSLGRGGAETLLPGTLRTADRRRFEYAYGYFLPWKDDLVGELRALDAEVTCFGARSRPGMLASARRVADRLEAWEADLVHCHLPLAGVVGRLAGRIAGVPAVYTEHNTLERYHALTRWLHLRTWGWQERAFAVSGPVAASLARRANGGVPVQVVRNGIDVERFDPERFEGTEIRARCGIPETALVVGTVAVFRTQKALGDWLEAARRIHAQMPDSRFLLVGDGPERERLEQRAAELGLAEAVHFPGLQDDVRPWLAAMDLFVSASVFEGLPLALLEAMAMARPVVATRVGGVPEAVTDGSDGLLVEPRDPELLAERCLALLHDRNRGRCLGTEARRRVAADFGLQRMSRQLEAAYVDVLGARERVPA